MRSSIFMLFLLLANAAAAHDYAVGDLVIAHPMAFATPESAMTGAGYLTITNNGDAADTLLAVEADYPQVQVHTTAMQDGMATMTHIDGLTIAPGETVTLEPGGTHVMFMGLNGKPFNVGDKIDATLVFETAGRLDIVFHVEERAAEDAEEDHSGH